MSAVDVLIKNGHVVDPANDIDKIVDIAVKDKKIFAVGEDLNFEASNIFDASGCLVTPGLIDAHVHCYEYVTPLGINPDEMCLSRGVTTIIDAGSAGAATFPGLRKFIIEPSKTRVRCLLHIALHGLAAVICASGAPGGECDTLAVLDEEACQKCIEENRDVIVGVKVRLSADICSQGNTEEEAYRRALSVAQKCKVPLMTHHAESSIPTTKSQGTQKNLTCPGDLLAGDVYTHAFQGFSSTIVDPKTRSIWGDVIDARSRGVFFDVGHGQYSFSWTVAEVAAQQGFWPDMLGTDLHTGNYEGPAYDMPTVMSKFLHLGMPLVDIIRSVTITPAKAFGLDDSIGSLTIGKEADIVVLRIEDCEVMMEDSQAQIRNLKKRIIPTAVWRAGTPYPVTRPEPWPNMESRRKIISQWRRLQVRDDEEPSL